MYKTLFILMCANFALSTTTGKSEYMSERSKLIEEEAALMTGADIELNDQEQNVNNVLMRRKFKEVDNGVDDPQHFNYSHHYFTYKDTIKDSKVYEIIKAMPKGALLHLHDMGIMGPDYLLNITYMDHLYVCFYDTDVQLLFSKQTPQTPCGGRWQGMNDARRLSSDVKKFDADLQKHFSIIVSDPDEVYTDVNTVWRAFMKVFTTILPLLSHRPVWEQYFYDALKAMREDNIMYAEVRSVLPELYDLDGTKYDQLVTAKAYRKVARKFMRDYPDFLGAKLIYAPSRHVSRGTVSRDLELAKRIKNDMPDFFAGFDLVGQEDLGQPLVYFAEELNAAKEELRYFFHAGETVWWGSAADDNLVDALVLGARRLGHAFALPKRPRLLREAVRRGVALEVNVLSNCVLCMVRDLRNHPLAVLLAQGAPVVLASDDPGLWGAAPLSHDFHVAFLAVASRRADLRLLKRLALNSVQYSAMQPNEKESAMSAFHQRWNHFISQFQNKAD